MHHPNEDEDEKIIAYTVSRFCRAVGLGRSKVYDEIKHGRLKPTRVGGRTLITVRNARLWMKSYEEAE